MAIISIPLEGILHGRKPAAPVGYYWRPWKGLLILAKSPGTGKYKRSDLQNAWVANFKEIACYTKWVDPRTFDNATNLAKGTNWYYRDVIETALSNKLIQRPGEIRVTTPTVKLKRTATEAVVNGVEKYLTPTSALWDNNVFWNATVNPSRMTFRSPGLYSVGALASFNAIAGGVRYVNMRLNRTTDITKQDQPGSSVADAEINLSTIYYFHANDYLEINVYGNSTGLTCLVKDFWAVAITPEAII